MRATTSTAVLYIKDEEWGVLNFEVPPGEKSLGCRPNERLRNLIARRSFDTSRHNNARGVYQC